MTPENFRSSSGEDFYISGYGKSIALSKRYYTNIREPCLDIWLMEESWTKLTTLCPPGPETGVCYRPLCIRKSGDLVLVPTDGYTDITMPNLMLRASSYLTRPMQFLTEEKNRAVAQFLKRESSISSTSEDVTGDLSLDKILERKTRKLCARMFYETLVIF
ncbi:hypothetical protein C1H46_017688 [Malus baccata]|uniref:Rad21/Rec8-like protein C-terminal eukaryotic domain-containing protein n=1 Tax=Malus baccata TaxID=106549 RepID=A0A540MD56_MALBA|nr:hypothetical protein C1H46_017688 [Malus baccata]